MIKANELRIGNYIIDTTDEVLAVTQIKKNEVKVRGYKHFVDQLQNLYFTGEELKINLNVETTKPAS